MLAQHLNERLELYSLIAGRVLKTCHRSGYLVVGSTNHDSNPRCGRGRALVIAPSVDARRSPPRPAALDRAVRIEAGYR
jgi:hypothetical protein